jgi:hypothetical protein
MENKQNITGKAESPSIISVGQRLSYTRSRVSVSARPHPVNGKKRGRTLFAGLLHSVRNDVAHLSEFANPQGEAIQKADNEEERIHVIVSEATKQSSEFQYSGLLPASCLAARNDGIFKFSNLQIFKCRNL